ncbi:MAG: TonB-dependent receptor [Phycisphaerales bacterium]
MGARKILWIVILLFGLSASTRAGADGLSSVEPNGASEGDDLFEMSIEELMDVRIDTVYGASKHAQRLDDAPASVTVVTAEEIHKYGYRTLAEILRSAPGFYINYDRIYHSIGTRGFRRPGDFDTRILVLIDGHRVNENIAVAPPVGVEFPLDVELIEKVEIIRGPGSSLYGSNALLAVVNVITKRGEEINGLEAAGQTGSFDAYKGRITYGNLLGKDVDLLLSASTYSSDGPTLYFKEFDTPETNNGSVKNDDDRCDRAVANVSWGDFSFMLVHGEREKGVPTAPYHTVFGDSRTRVYSDGTMAGLTWTRELSERYTVKARLAYGRFDYDGRYAVDHAEEPEEPDLAINGDSWRGRWWEGELEVMGSPVEGHTLTAGTEFRYNARQDQTNWSADVVYLDDSRHSHNWGVYVQDEMRLLEKLTFVGGVRHDEYRTFGGSTNPRLGLIYDFFDQTTLKLLYGRAFRAPSAYELYYQDGGQSQQAPDDLEPETIQTYEAIVERQLNRNLLATAGGFYYVMEDLIDQYLDPADGLLVFRNLGEVQAEGIELALRGRWEGGLQSRVSYSYVEARDETADEALANSPEHLVKLGLIKPVVPERLFAGLEVLYDSKAKTLAGDYANDFTLTNLTLTYVSASKRLEIAASVYNLFDVEYAFPGSGGNAQDAIEQDGRTFRVGLTYRF